MNARLLTPDSLNNLKNLSLVAHRVVEGFLAGLHQSPFHGYSLEFAEYRQYMPGDDLRYFEWKALGKSDRCYIKKFQCETNMRGHLLLDASASMGFASGKVTKLRYGAALSAALAHLMIRQHDALGITVFSDRILRELPTGRGPRQRHLALSLLERLRPDRGTRIAGTLHRLAESLERRSMVVLISDLLDEPGEILDGINHLNFQGHEVIVFQVMDPAERDFSFSGLCEFEDLETGERLQVHSDSVRQTVRDEVKAFTDGLHQDLASRSIDHLVALTSEPFDLFLGRYLHRRLRSTPWSS